MSAAVRNFTMNGPALARKRLYVRCLMSKIELDTSRITLMHRPFFENAKLDLPILGSPVDDALQGLDGEQLMRLAKALHERIGDEEED